MKKAILILFIFPFVCYAQDETDVVKNDNLSIGFSFTPESAYRTTKVLDVVGESLLPASKSEKSKFGFTTGLSLDYRITDRFSFETGMLFSNKGYKDNLFVREDENDFQGKEMDIHYNFCYLEVPLKAKFYFTKLHGFSCYASAGFIPQTFISKNIKLENGTRMDIYPDGSVNSNSVNVSTFVGLGLKYNLNSYLFLDVEAGYKHSIVPMNDEALKRYFYSLGLDFTLYYKF